MEHDVTGKILAAGSGPGGVGSSSCWPSGGVGSQSVTMCGGDAPSCRHSSSATTSGAGHMGVGFERVESAQEGKPCG